MQHAMRLFEVFRPFQFGRATTYATRGPLDVLSDPAYLLHYWSHRDPTG